MLAHIEKWEAVPNERLSQRMAVTLGPAMAIIPRRACLTFVWYPLLIVTSINNVPQLHPDRNEVSCQKLGLHMPKWTNLSLSGANHHLCIEIRDTDRARQQCSSLSIAWGRKSKPKTFCGHQCEQDFEHAQGLLLNVFFSSILSPSVPLLPAIESKTVMYIKMLCLSDGVHSYSGTILLTDR